MLYLVPFLAALAILYELLFSPRGLRSLRIDLLDHLSLVTARGLPLAPGLIALADERRASYLAPLQRRHEARVLQGIAAGLQSHGSLGEALAEVPGLLAPDQLALLRQAEAQGSLPAVLEQLSEESREQEAGSFRFLEVGLYVLVLSVMVVAVSSFLGLVILPKFAEIEASMGVDHGVSREAAMTVTQAYVLLCVSVLVLFGPGRLGRRLRWHALRGLAALPGVGRPLRRWLQARWLQRVAALLQHGATLPEALASAAAGSPASSGHAEAAARAREGCPLAEVLEVGLGVDAPALAPSLLLTVERAGSLAEGWADGAARIGERARRRLITWGEALRPVPLLACATVVASQYLTVWLSIIGIQRVVIGGVW